MRTSAHLLLAVIFALSLFSPARAGTAPEGWHSGVGSSLVENHPYEAGLEAAEAAKAGLDGVPAKIVIVTAAAELVTPDLLKGIATYFDPSIVYGCQVTSVLNAETNFPDVKTIDVPIGVSVWALGGDIDIEPFWVTTEADSEDPYYDAGIALGEKLRPVLENSARPGKLVVTFGDQYNGSNIDFVTGMNDGLEDIYPIIGAAAGNNTAKEIVQGEIVTGVNVAFFLGGEFRLGQAMNGGTHTPETADKTLEYAISQGDGEEPFFALIFNCRRRRQGMIERNQLAEEHAAMVRRLPGIEFFGFYGPGEVGATDTGERARGVGFTVVAAVFFPAK